MKKINLAITFYTLLTSILIMGCASVKEPEPGANAFSVVIGLDGTGSYKHASDAEAEISRLLDNLPAGTELCIRYITDNSYKDDNRNEIISIKLPDTCTSIENPFDVQEKLRVIKAKKALDSLKINVINSIRNAKSPQASRTDIFGFLLNAKEWLSQVQASNKLILILSDLDNNNLKYKPFVDQTTLNGIDVYVCSYQHNDNPQIFSYWDKTFSALGAKSHRFLSKGQNITLLTGRG
jgi:hypothetical protein